MNWLNLLVFLLVVGLPALGQLVKKLEEKRAERQAEIERQRARDAMLRTGRISASEASEFSSEAPEQYRVQPVGASREDSLASQRRARLEQLRAQQLERLREAAARRQQQQTASSSPSRQTPPSPQRPAPVRRGTTPAQASSRTRQIEPASPAPAQRQPTRPPVQAPPQRRQTLSSPFPTTRSESRKSSSSSGTKQSRETIRRQRQPGELANAPSRPISAPRSMRYGFQPAPASVTLMGHTMSIQDWKRAFVLREVLGPPIALRPIETGIPGERP